jgi:hypothetical protein
MSTASEIATRRPDWAEQLRDSRLLRQSSLSLRLRLNDMSSAEPRLELAHLQASSVGLVQVSDDLCEFC